MAGNLQERIDFALNYQVDPSELDKAAETLGKLEAQNEKTKKSVDEDREAWTKKRREMMETGKTAQMTEEMQKRLSIAVSNTNETVRDARLGMELLKLEYQEGDISQEQYTQGIQELRNRLEGADVITLSQARALRQLSAAQRQAGGQTQSMNANVGRANATFTSFTHILQDLPYGLNAISNNIPQASAQFSNLSLKAGGSGAALKSILGIVTGPGGIILALTSLIPLIAVASRNMDLFNTDLIDGEAAGEAYNSVLQDIIENMTTIEGFEAEAPFNTNQLQQQLSLYQRSRQENERALEILREERQVLTDMAISGRLIGDHAERHESVLQEIEVREASSEKVNERIEKLKAEILANEVLLTDETSKRLALEQQLDPLFERRLELIEEAHQRRIDNLEEEQEIIERDQQWRLENFERIDKMRLDAQQRILDGIKQRRQAREQERQQELAFQKLLLNPPRRQIQQDDEGPAIENALIQQRLAEDARLAMVQDSVSREKFIRLQMQQQFEQERLDLIRQGITDQQALDNLRILQQRDLQDRLLQLQEEELGAKLNLWSNYEAAVQGFGQAIVEGSGANAKQMFEMNKALNLAMAISSGARAVVEALPNIPLAISVGAMAAAQIARIAATQYKGGGSTQSTAADRPQIAFRGIQADTVQGAAVPQPQQVNMPDTVRLVDSAGNLLTKLEWERDKEGGSAYVSGRSS